MKTMYLGNTTKGMLALEKNMLAQPYAPRAPLNCFRKMCLFVLLPELIELSKLSYTSKIKAISSL